MIQALEECLHHFFIICTLPYVLTIYNRSKNERSLHFAEYFHRDFDQEPKNMNFQNKIEDYLSRLSIVFYSNGRNETKFYLHQNSHIGKVFIHLSTSWKVSKDNIEIGNVVKQNYYLIILSISFVKQEQTITSSSMTRSNGATRSHIPCMQPTSRCSQTQVVTMFLRMSRFLRSLQYSMPRSQRATSLSMRWRFKLKVSISS